MFQLSSEIQFFPFLAKKKNCSLDFAFLPQTESCELWTRMRQNQSQHFPALHVWRPLTHVYLLSNSSLFPNLVDK